MKIEKYIRKDGICRFNVGDFNFNADISKMLRIMRLFSLNEYILAYSDNGDNQAFRQIEEKNDYHYIYKGVDSICRFKTDNEAIIRYIVSKVEDSICLTLFSPNKNILTWEEFSRDFIFHKRSVFQKLYSVENIIKTQKAHCCFILDYEWTFLIYFELNSFDIEPTYNQVKTIINCNE